MCGVTVWGGGGQEHRPKRIALPFRPACAVSGSSRGIQAAPRSAPAGRGGRGWEPGAWVQVGEGTASSRELGRGVRRGGLGQHCPERVLRVLITGRNVVFAFFSFRLCERGWVFTRRGAAGSHGTEVRWSRVRGQVVAAQRGSCFPPVLAAWPSSWPPPALFLPCTSERVSGVLRLQRTLAPQGALWQKWPQACPGRGEGAAQAPAVPWAGRRDGTAVSAPHPSKPQLPGFDSGPAGSGVMRPSTCGHRLRGQRGQSRTTGCLRSAEGPEGPALSGGVLWAPGLRSMACQHQLYRPKDERRPPSPGGALLGAHSALPRGSPVRVPARSTDSGGAVAFADVPSGRWV